MSETFNEPFPLAYGTYEDAVKLLNKPGEKVVSEFSVNWEMIKIYCSMVEDGNPSYWDEEYANKQWGGIVAPSGLLLTWPMSLQWHPHKERKHYFIAMTIPLLMNSPMCRKKRKLVWVSAIFSPLKRNSLISATSLLLCKRIAYFVITFRRKNHEPRNHL